MRTVLTITSVLSLCLFASTAARADDPLLTAKVYRDYPGYINPAVCENPNRDKAAPANPLKGSGSPPASSPITNLPSKTSPGLVQKAGHYVTVWAGMVMTDDLEINSSVDMSIDDGYGVGGAIGYDLGRVRLEVEGSYREGDGDKIKTSSSKINASEDLEVLAILVNGYADFATGGPVTPYFGAGIGVANAEVDDLEDDVGVAQLAAGIAFAVTSEVAIDLGYRYLFPVSESDFDLQQHTALLGFQVRF